MGAGCSSPLRRLGGKRAKQTTRDSASTVLGDTDNPEQMSIAAKLQLKQPKREQQHQQQHQASETKDRHTFNIENEITIQSEVGEDHPSSASYYTDGKNQPDLGGPKSDGHHLDKQARPNGNATAARIMGFGASIPYDRHLLVSPALSPAPSICQSPSPPASSFIGCPIPLNLNDLEEAFTTLTFGPASNHQFKNKIRPEQQQQQGSEFAGSGSRSEFCNYYSRQLVQSREDLIAQVSVVFIATDYLTDCTDNIKSSSASSGVEAVASQLESSLRAACDEQSFNLKFLNLSHDHLMKCLYVNNVQDAAMRTLEEEYRENSQRIVVIILSNGVVCFNNGSSGSGGEQQPTVLTTTTQQGGGDGAAAMSKPVFSDKRLLPTKIDAQLMNKLLDMDETILSSRVKELLKLWYNQVANIFYLRPIYSVNKKILSKIREEREQAWHSWLVDSDTMLKALILLCDSSEHQQQEFQSQILFKSLFSSYIDFITNEPQLQKRTMLIRNYSTISSQQQQQQLTSMATTANAVAGEKLGLNDLARHLADPCKLTLKRNQIDDEFSKTITDWVVENFGKYVESFLECRISSGKYTPPFIERNLFIELTRQRHYLDHFLDNISDNFLSKCHNFYTSQLEAIFSNFNEGFNLEESSTGGEACGSGGGVGGGDLSESKQSLASQPSANHLIFISGPKGCGKTTLFAQIVRLAAQELLYKVQIIYRFCGFTIDSVNSNRVLRSICEQFCQSQGENTTAACYIYSSRQREIMEALNKIIRSRNVLILLDGIEAFTDQTETCLEWLCELEASPRIKIVMTLETDSDLYKKVLNTYTDATHITLDNPTNSEWAQMLASTARQHRFNIATNFYDELKNLDNKSESTTTTTTTTITYKDASDVLYMRRMMVLNNEHVFAELTTKMAQISSLENLKNVHRVIWNQLQYILPPYLLCCLLVALDTSRNGLSELEIIEIMELIGRKHPEAKQGIKFSDSLLSYLKVQLRPWLRVMICDRVIKLAIHKDFASRLIGYYVPSLFPKIIGDVRETLIEYYSRPLPASITGGSDGQTKRGSKSGGLVSFSSVIGDSGDHHGSSPQTRPHDKVSRTESIWLGTQASEMMNLLIQTNPSKAKSSFMSKHNFYQQFIHRSIPEEFIEDHDRLRAAITGQRKMSQNEELQHLVNFIRQSIFPLRYDGSQIYSQIYCRSYETYKSGRSSKSKKFNDILAVASCPPIWSLLPVSDTSIDSFIKTRIGPSPPNTTTTGAGSIVAGTTQTQSSAQLDSQQQQQKTPAVLPSNQLRQPTGPPVSAYQQSSKQRIFTIKDNHRHVIAIYPDKNRLAVWDIFEEKAVRIINDIDHPRDLRMIDQKRAVVLCNRELRVYDLDSGCLLSKLKGVMNQKMPYFEIFGQDYVIALARNRMYVNMLNINTGELETTFKVGEDRFLNSLLVSAEGGICVCGDETQKPFPLLVWNLNERRLMYDLRLDRHEFITRMSAISDDGHFVVSVCRQLGDSNEQQSSGGGASGGAVGVGGSTPSQGGTSPKATAPNFIVIYDLNSGTLFKKWKPGLDTCAVAITLSANRSGKLVNALVDSSILVWDLTTGSKRHTLVGHSAPVDVIKVQSNRLFSMDSTCRDQSLRIWDIDEGYCLVVFSPDAPISSCQMSAGGDALVCSFAAETRLSTLVMCKNDTVNDVLKRNKRRKSSKSSYVFDEPPSRKSST
uniref:F-box/WD repeat-containing protein 7 n=1 Tax=Aceria tosichella TaxID=561515 RepID=A0A6G1SC42_9ACAR